MPFIKIQLDFNKDQRVKKMRSRVGSALATHAIVTLWRLAAMESPRDGRLAKRPVRELESALGWSGADSRMEQSLIESGFLEKDEEGYLVLNWGQEQGHIAKFKERATKAANALWKGNTVDATSNATSNASSISGAGGVAA